MLSSGAFASHIAVFLTIAHSSAFSVFPQDQTMQRTTPSTVDNVQIEVPDFDILFANVCEVSPLASTLIRDWQDANSDGGLGKSDRTTVTDGAGISNLKWKGIESVKNGAVQKIEKIDNFKGRGCPVVRFKSSLRGPCIGMKFVEYITDVKERSQWDPQIDTVYQKYPAYDTASANIAMDFRYGDCQVLGIGYTKTKSYLVVDGREQLTLCGLQQFSNGGCIIWGVELEERHDHLFPDCERHVRAKTHLFSTTLMPTGPDTFDAEYVLQLEVGGNLPNFLTTKIMIEAVKGMFQQAKLQFSDEEYMTKWKSNQEKMTDEAIKEKLGLLMTP